MTGDRLRRPRDALSRDYRARLGEPWRLPSLAAAGRRARGRRLATLRYKTQADRKKASNIAGATSGPVSLWKDRSAVTYLVRHPSSKTPAWLRASLVAVACVGLVGACESAPGDYAAPVAVPAQFTTTGTAVLPDKWWESFDDSALNELVEHALADNLSLRGTWAKLDQSRATMRQARAERLPSVDLGGGVEGAKQKTEANGGRVDTDSDFDLGLSSSYEIDLWGRVRSTADAAALDAQATEQALRTAAITLSAEVASAWYQLVEDYGQIDLLTQQLETNQSVLQLVELRFRRGQVSATDVLQQRQQVESVRGDLALAEAAAAVTRNALAILLGLAPGTPDIPRINDLAELPPLPATGIPADLVKKRPDVREAYADVLAADRRVAAAIADRYPTLSLSASVSASAANIRDVLDNWMASLAANLVAPLFDAGARQAEVDRTRAVVEQQLATYGETILSALGEVEDALIREARQHAYLDSLEKQIALSDQTIERMQDSYAGGAVDYISVLNAYETNQDLERSYLTARRQLVDYRIDLCRALAGGWEMNAPARLAHNPEP